MASANKLFHDALLRRQIALAHFERNVTNDVLTMFDKTERDLRITLMDKLTSVSGRDVQSASVVNRLRVLERAIQEIRKDPFGQARAHVTDQLEGAAKAEAEYVSKALNTSVPVRLETQLPSEEQLAGLVTSQPLQGRVLNDWFGDLEDLDNRRIMDSIRIGMSQGEDNGDITRRVVGSQNLDGADGILQLTRNDFASLISTAVSTVANESRQAFYQANDDILKKEVWVATLDDATCPECGDLDGEEFEIGEGDQPPLHFNCRCVRVAEIDGAAVGDRPANAATADELDGLEGDERRDRVKELVGQVPTTTRYSEWLGDQSASFQDHVLGPSRGSLFRDGGMKLGRFTNSNGNMYTLDQLREMSPSSFRKAGI